MPMKVKVGQNLLHASNALNVSYRLIIIQNNGHLMSSDMYAKH